MCTGLWWGNLRERDHLEDPGVNGRSSGPSRSGIWERGLDRAGSEKGQVAGNCEFGNDLSGCIKCGEFLN